MVFFFNYTGTTEIYTYDTLFPSTTLFRSKTSIVLRQVFHDILVVTPLLQLLGKEYPRQVARKFAHGMLEEDVFAQSRRDRQTSERSEEHTSELQSLMRISYAVFCLKKTKKTKSDLMTNITQSIDTQR